MKNIKIVIFDDHPLVRQGLFMVLNNNPEIEIIGEATCINDAINILISKKPDIALVDLKLGNEYGLDIIKQAHNQNIECKFIVITSSNYEHDFLKAKKLNIHGYILKEAFPEEILLAIKIVVNNKKYYDPSLCTNIIENTIINKDLTTREKEVVIELGKGLNNKEIARKLFITEYTVKKHIGELLSKLNLKDRTQIALYAIQNGFVVY